MVRPEYPAARLSDHVDTYHGQAVPDPYRWLEDPDSPESRAWIEAQNRLTEAYLSGLPGRDHFRTRLTQLWDMPRRGAPWKRGGRYFQWQNTGLQNQDVLQVADQLDGPWRPLLDPNTLREDGTAAINSHAAGPGGQRLAYAVSDGGSDWQTWTVRDVVSGQDLPDRLEWSKFSGAAWLPDGSGFYYGRYPQPETGEALTSATYGQTVYLHRLGTAQSEDQLIYARPDQPEWGFYPQVSDDGTLLVLYVTHGTRTQNMLLVRPLAQDGDFTTLTPLFEAAYQFVGNDGPLVYALTDQAAPQGRLMVADLRAPEAGWQEVVPESSDTLEAVQMVPGGFLLLSLHDASHRLALVGRDGQGRQDIALPTLGTVTSLNTHPDDPEVLLGFTSFLYPQTAYRLTLPDLTLQPLFAPTLDFNVDAYETRQLFATSRDGTRVPMFVVHRKGLALTGDHPTLLYGYGGFNVSLTPSFSVSRLPWLEQGGVYVVANLRGGGEYGLAWHEAGMLERKQNVFDDFIACAEHLIQQGYTAPAHLGIQGGSNGGLLVGACLTQRPELFGAALPAVGVMDMLRFQRFTIGWAWTSDYGSSDDPEQFQTLLAYSPLHNLKDGVAYPPTLITTGDHDDRVVPAHSFKFAARMQAAQAGDAPVLIRIQTRGGHGAGKPTALVIEEQADLLTFLSAQLQ
ncbi:prolyl oligopeptidase family serine peptidase [Deinococcus sonorensis]|uniref:prolyl oligopeptidase n=2 Tax=Deinococcus sonorensis TaxID=309891 RepID=A0AAU7UE92_9DEIO